LLQQPDPNQSCDHIYLAARCVGEVRNRGELGSTEVLVRQATKDLIGFKFGNSATSVSGEVVSGEVWQNASMLEEAVMLVAYVWKDDPDTLPWIKEQAQSNQNEAVRGSALNQLRWGWAEDPDTLTIIKERAESDKSWIVRAHAVLGLVRWKTDPATLKVLKECAQSDEEWVLRLCSVSMIAMLGKEIAMLGKEDTDTLAILKEIAQSDEDDNVRKNAAEQLDKFWKDDAEIQAFLKGLRNSSPAI
jgi:HEAT repeat protein